MNLMHPIWMEGTTLISSLTHFAHEFVTDFANLSMYILEFLSISIIVVTTVIAFYKLFMHKPFARVYLLHGQSVGLTFKLGAEILRTVTARSISDIWEIFLLIVIKACMVLLIEWELHGIEDPYTTDGFSALKEDRKKNRQVHSPFFFKGAHNSGHQSSEEEEIAHIQQELNELKGELHPETAAAPQKKGE